MKPVILIVEDEPDAIDLIEYNLVGAGYRVKSTSSGSEALALARSILPNLIILDVMLPEIDGFDLCKLLRRSADTASVPIIMLTAKAAEDDRVRGLELGADDYVTKPFSPRELVLRVKKLLTRRNDAEEVVERFQIGDLSIDVPRHSVTFRGEKLDLTATEFKLLSVLVQRRGFVQSRDLLLRDVWNYDSAMDTRTVDTHVRRLREKLGGASVYLETVRGVGYRFKTT